MAVGFTLCVVLLLSVWTTSTCHDGVAMECRDRYFFVTAGLSFTGEDPCFEAVDRTGVYAITEQYAAECGYSISVLPLSGHVELRASYFSCHTDNKDDEVFTFNFNLITHHDGQDVTHALNKTCSPSLPWSPREVTCEVNYMEVSVQSDVICPSETRKDDWDSVVQTAYSSAASVWQVMFQRDGEQMQPMNLSEAHKHGYMFDLTDGRLVFRTPYGQPDSFSTEVNGVPVEVVHATLFSRQSWVVLMVDLVAACSTYEGSYDDGHMVWETPEMLHPVTGHKDTISIGVNGKLVEQSVAEDRGYTVEKRNTTFHIRVPYNAEGGYRKSYVSGDLYEYYIFHLYLEHLSEVQGHIDTRLRFHRTLSTPLLPRPVVTEDRTVVEEHEFTVYLGDVPDDVKLAAVHVNGQELNMSSYTLTELVDSNTHSYTLKVPFDDPVIRQQFSKEDAAMKHEMDLNYTLAVLPGDEPYYHTASVAALTAVSPPQFDAVCSETGISFKLDYRPFDYLWEIFIGSDLLTSELAAQNGYIMSNTSQSLQLNMPLFTQGFEYTDVSLKGFSATFEIVVRDRETSEVQTSTVKTCPFTSTELIMCSTDGRMTVVADLSHIVSTGGVPARANLMDKYCGPKEADDTRALFSFPLNSCGSRVKLGKEYVTYENEIFISQKLHSVKSPADPGTDGDRVLLQCTYPLVGLHRLFSVYKFESDTVGIGRIVHSSLSTEASPTVAPTTVSTTGHSTRRILIRPGYSPSAQYIKVSNFLKNISKKSWYV